VAKQALFELLEERFGSQRERYFELVAPGSELDAILEEGAAKVQGRARTTMQAVREAIGCV
jgi:tryptophanyl-tRNA synthetase